jgi:hypothetical protein
MIHFSLSIGRQRHQTGRFGSQADGKTIPRIQELLLRRALATLRNNRVGIKLRRGLAAAKLDFPL